MIKGFAMDDERLKLCITRLTTLRKYSFVKNLNFKRRIL